VCQRRNKRRTTQYRQRSNRQHHIVSCPFKTHQTMRTADRNDSLIGTLDWRIENGLMVKNRKK
jgi:hypothetical protein